MYGDEYYKDQILLALQSARIVLGHLWKYFQPKSVLDVGCGRGAWLKACQELGSEDLIGLDGTWNTQAAMIDGRIRFRGVDLNQPIAVDTRVDLAMSVEVAEHLEPASSIPLVQTLTKASDVVLFGAAFIGQNGPTHTNERQHSWWARQFRDCGYAPFDLFRPHFWGDEAIEFWYRQNTFLYVNTASSAYAQLTARGLAEVSDVRFMDCIHPELYRLKTGHVSSFWTHVRSLFPSLVRAVRRRMG